MVTGYNIKAFTTPIGF